MPVERACSETGHVPTRDHRSALDSPPLVESTAAFHVQAARTPTMLGQPASSSAQGLARWTMETMKPFLGCILAVMPLACGSAGAPEEYPVNERLLREMPDRPVLVGGGCLVYHAGLPAGTSTGSAGPSPDFIVEQKFDGTRLLVLASSGDTVLFQRQYERTFLLSGQTDIATVSTPSGSSYQLRYWGSTECQSVNPNETYP